MWWEFHRLMELTPEQLVDERRPDRPARADRAARRAAKSGKQTWRYAFPTQDFDLGRSAAGLFDPARKQARPGRHRRSTGLSATSSRSMPRPARSTSGERRLAASARRRARCRGSADARAAGVALRDRGMGRGPRHRWRRPRTGRPATCCSAARLASARRPARRSGGPRRRTSTLPGDWPWSLDRTTLPIQGPPGSGKTFSGARMILHAPGAGQASRDHRNQPQGHRQPAQGRARRRGGAPGVDVRPVQRGDRGPGPRRRPRSRAARTPIGRPRQARRSAGPTSPPVRHGCGRRPG